MSRYTRTGWRCIEASSLIAAMLPQAAVYRKELDDGVLQVIVGPEPQGFHLSISHTGWSTELVDGTSIRKRKLTRFPDWEEIASARYEPPPSQDDDGHGAAAQGGVRQPARHDLPPLGGRRRHACSERGGAAGQAREQLSKAPTT